MPSTVEMVLKFTASAWRHMDGIEVEAEQEIARCAPGEAELPAAHTKGQALVFAWELS